jgi:hypothetical protein
MSAERRLAILPLAVLALPLALVFGLAISILMGISLKTHRLSDGQPGRVEARALAAALR